MPHPLVTQLRFTRDEFVRGLTGLSDEEARRRFQPINSISWVIGHLAWQEQRNWLTRAQGQIVRPDLNERVANGKPASTPPLEEMWTAWRAWYHLGEALAVRQMLGHRDLPDFVGDIDTQAPYRPE